MSLELLLYGTVFLAVLVTAELVLSGMFGDRRAQKGINRRLKLRAKGAEADQVLATLKRTSVGSVRAGGGGPRGLLDRLLLESGASMSARQLFLAMLAVAAGLWVLLVAMAPGSAVAAAFPAIGAGILLPVLMLRIKRTRRIRQFGEQLPDALDMIVRSLRAGHPIRTALGMVSEEMSDPIGTEFGIVVDEMTYGLDLSEALENLRNRVGHMDLHYMVVSMNIQERTGGNLADVLANLSSVIRDRFRMFKKARALSAEGRLAAVIIGLMPFVIALVMMSIKADYYSEVSADPLFLAMMVGAVVFYVGSMVAIWRIINIEV